MEGFFIISRSPFNYFQLFPHSLIRLFSTQMSITDGNGVKFTKNILGLERIVIGRELSIKEIASVIRHNNDVEVEAFVHGALCVSYSGQCYSSEAWGGRSANRGQCSQACRMPYGLIVNGTLTKLTDDVQYLLSPQDLCAVDFVPDLIRAGVTSFKIEGRLKGPEYVYATTQAYRQAVDDAWSILTNSSISDTGIRPNIITRRELKQTFARGQDEFYDGLSTGFLNGVKHQHLVRGKSPRHRGSLVGKVLDVGPQQVTLELLGPIRRGDGIVFDRGLPEEVEEGGSIYSITFPENDKRKKSANLQIANEEIDTGIVALTFGKNLINFSRIKSGNLVWKTKDIALESKLSKLSKDKDGCNKYSKQKVQVAFSGVENEPLKLILTAILNEETNYTVNGIGYSTSKLELALTNPITTQHLMHALGTLGNSSFYYDLNSIDASGLAKNVFLSPSELKELRRNALISLENAMRVHNKADNFKAESPLFEMQKAVAMTTTNNTKQQHGDCARLSILCRTPEQVSAACLVPWVQEIYLDFLEIHGVREKVNEIKRSNKRCIICTPRIIKPEEEKLLFFYLKLHADGILVRSAGLLQQINELGGPGAWVQQANTSIPQLLIGDSYLNTANSLTAKLFLEAGLTRITPTNDLNANQIINLSKLLKNQDKLECILHSHLSIFHTEHCVFCRFLSNGDNYTNCGHPCETNSVSLRDMNGEDHLVLADQGCRNTVFNSKAQSGINYIQGFLSAGIVHYRIELVDEPAEYVEPILQHYRNALNNKPGSIDTLSKFLESIPNKYNRQFSFTDGSLLPKEEIEWAKMKPVAYEKK